MASWADVFKGLAGGFQLGSAIKDVADAYSSAKVSQVQSAAQKAANEAQAKVAENNAQLAVWQAQDAMHRGAVDESRSRLGTAGLKGTQRARMAANNIALDEGSALRVLTDTDVLGEIEANTVADNAAREAWAYRVQAQDSRNRAEILRNASVPVPDSTSGALMGSLLSGAGKVASTWYQWSR